MDLGDGSPPMKMGAAASAKMAAKRSERVSFIPSLSHPKPNYPLTTNVADDTIHDG